MIHPGFMKHTWFSIVFFTAAFDTHGHIINIIIESSVYIYILLVYYMYTVKSPLYNIWLNHNCLLQIAIRITMKSPYNHHELRPRMMISYEINGDSIILWQETWWFMWWFPWLNHRWSTTKDDHLWEHLHGQGEGTPQHLVTTTNRRWSANTNGWYKPTQIWFYSPTFRGFP